MNCSVVLIPKTFPLKSIPPKILVFRVLVMELDLVQACYLVLRMRLLLQTTFPCYFVLIKYFLILQKLFVTYQKTQMYSLFLFQYHFLIQLSLKFQCLTVLLNNVLLLNCLLMILFLHDHINFDQYHFI